ncbi:MAG TPA: fatty acid desaturase, partial [Baekduia sp.]|nr:fatty acid desaturase [Baekduia sp.]
MSVDVADRPQAQAPERHALPDPGAPVPKLALPTVGVYVTALAVFVVSTVLAVGEDVPVWVTILTNAAVTFVMFTVVHDASHFSISSTRWVNGLFGRLAWVHVSPFISFPSFAFIHIEHHRHANDDDHDPDTFASHGPTWQLPLRWVATDLFYGAFYARSVRRRPKPEVLETAAMFTLSTGGLVAAIATGNLWTLAVVFLIPQRIGITLLAWWFDWLPHHGLEDTQRSNRYGATRARVGMEWLFTPLMLSQNYHLVHHLHPSVPFYRYLATWRRNEEAYLERDAEIATVFGQKLDAGQFREWKELNKNLLRVLPVRMPKGSSATHGVFHRIPVAAVDRLTPDSTLVTFGVPEELQDQFRFDPGQHVTVCTDLG